MAPLASLQQLPEALIQIFTVANKSNNSPSPEHGREQTLQDRVCQGESL